MEDSTPQATTSKQMALDLFEDSLNRGLSIAEAPSDIGYQRNNAIVHVSNLGTSAYRALDALAFVVLQEKDIQGRYDVDLTYFRWLMRYDSQNYRHLRAVLRELQQAAIQVSDDIEDESLDSPLESWASIPFLGQAAIKNGRVVFEMSPVLQRQLKDPEKAHWLSLRSSSALTLLYARVIYNHVLVYLAEGISPWIPLETVQAWPGEGSSASPYKYFKRDSLEPAIAQINELTNINISYDSHNEPGSRKIGYLRFRVSLKESMKVLGDVEELRGVDAHYRVLKEEFGLSPQNFNEINDNRDKWTDSWINQAIEFTRWNLAKKKVKSPSGFFMHALRNNLTVCSAERLIEEQNMIMAASRAAKAEQEARRTAEVDESIATSQKSAHQAMEEDAKAGWEAYEFLDLVAKEAVIKEFCSTLQAKLTATRAEISLEDLTHDVLVHNELMRMAFSSYMFLTLNRK